MVDTGTRRRTEWCKYVELVVNRPFCPHFWIFRGLELAYAALLLFLAVTVRLICIIVIASVAENLTDPAGSDEMRSFSASFSFRLNCRLGENARISRWPFAFP